MCTVANKHHNHQLGILHIFVYLGFQPTKNKPFKKATKISKIRCL